MLENFLQSNAMSMRLLRTILEGVIGVVLVSVPLIVGWWHLSPEVASLLTAIIVCVFSPILAMFKTGRPEDAVDKEDEEMRHE